MNPATRLAFVSFLAGAALAQIPDPIDASVQNPGPGGRHRHSPGRPADPVLLLAPSRTTPITLPGVTGVLEVDPAALIAVTGEAQLRAGLPVLTEALARSGVLYLQRLGAGASGPELSPLERLDPGTDLQFVQKDTLAACRARAQQRIDEVVGTADAAAWQDGATIAEVTPLHRPDVHGVAYYEFRVVPSGFVVVATGEHDAVVPHWNDVDAGPTAYLRRAAKAQRHVAVTFYKLDALCYVAEDEAGAMVAQLGSLPQKLIGLSLLTSGSFAGLQSDRPSALRQEPWSSWRELKENYATTYRPLIRNLRDHFARRWEAERADAGRATPQDWSAWTTYDAGTSTDQCDYFQWSIAGCFTGCGATAWAMLFGWGDRKAHAGNATWAGRTGLYREAGGRGSSTAVAPDEQDDGVENMTLEIKGQVRTWCSGGSGATNPWDMAQADAYLSGRTSTTLETHYNSVGLDETRLREYARDSIRDRDTPAIIGTGWLSHYPLAWKYRFRTKQVMWWTEYDREFYVNNGWEGTSGDGWVNASTWFAGEIHP